MQRLLIQAAISILSRLDWAAILSVLYAAAARRIPQPVLDYIDRLVRAVDDLDIPGEAKFVEVWSELTGPYSEVRAYLASTAPNALRWAIETAVQRVRAGS